MAVFIVGPETKAMETYIEDSLAAGGIRPSASPAGAGSFFVEEKGQNPASITGGLNDITVKNRYPLPLIASACEPLQGATTSLSWTSGTSTTWYGYGKVTRGRQPPTLLEDTMNTW